MGEKKKDNPTVWFSLKKNPALQIRAVRCAQPRNQESIGLNSDQKNRPVRLFEVHCKSERCDSRQQKTHMPPSCSPRYIGSSEFVNPIAHEVILSNSKCELKITGFGGFHEGLGAGDGSNYVGTLRPGTPGPGGQPTMQYYNPSFRNSVLAPPRKMASVLTERIKMESFEKDDSNGVLCHKCGENFVKWEALESHHLYKHAVTELMEGDSSRKIVEIICRSSLLKSENQSVKIDRVLKVHNMQRTLVRFEDYRETVRIKASKLPKKHPRCIADGNELLRFHGTTLACSLGVNGSSSLCVSDKCSVCRIIRHGFCTKRELKFGVEVFTTATSVRAFESIEVFGDDPMVRKALIVCRVIAGRVHRPLENVHEMAGQTGFDSLAGKVGLYSNIEELYMLNPKALLPCFVVICKV
ncbi:hypothetical protein CASFOL_010655 [Castilleja foliolosa]|uniref:C2H2-type domain-containing protein n=1 Tax=Castilleja foliolosa TaxID=1961234 RepID=A0ABD3DX88_9LAMI